MPQDRLELFTLKNRSLSALLLCGKIRDRIAAFYRNASFGKHALCGLLIAAATLGLTACGPYYYKFPVYTFANRPIPPSKLAERVMISVGNAGAGGAGGALAIIDALRDIRSNVENTVTSFSVSGFSAGNPGRIFSFPEQTRGYVYSNADGTLTVVNYGTESASGSGGSLPARSTGLAIPTDFARIFSAEESTGQLVVLDNATGKGYQLNLPNVYQVAANVGDTVALAMVRNSNTLYQVVQAECEPGEPSGRGGLPALQSSGVLRCAGAGQLRSADWGVLLAGRDDGVHPELRTGVRRYDRERECAAAGRAEHQQCSDSCGHYGGDDRYDSGSGRCDHGSLRWEHAVCGGAAVDAGWTPGREPVDYLPSQQHRDWPILHLGRHTYQAAFR